MAAYTARETLTDQPTCQSCIADGVPAVSFCSHVDCLTFMCRNCDQAHRTMRQFKDHALHSIEDLQKRPASHTSGQSLLCKEHRQNPLSLYCDEKSCQKAICVSCAATAHSSHRVVVLETKSFEAKKVLQSLVAEVRSKIDHTHLISGQLNTEKNLTSDLFKKRSAEVSAITKDLKELLTKRNDVVIPEMKKKCVDISSHLTCLADHAETLACRFKSACQDAEGACDIGNPIDLLNALAHHTAILHELNAIVVDEAISFHTDRETRFPSLYEDRDQLFSDFEKFVSRIGRLNASTGKNAVSFKIDFPDRVASPLYAKAMHRVRITSENPCCSFSNLSVCPYTFFQSPDGNTRDCKYVQQCGDSYEFEFKPLVAGLHQLHIGISGVPIKGSPFPVDIEETPPLMANTDDLSPRATNINKPDANSADAQAKILGLPLMRSETTNIPRRK
ncbi:E3 ubiquitin-protein ligase TRIM71-like [Patiria miniata]|uniref:B box-type domain-containing protein n=1 Tax=Patiria miniata TaxID=46514 RepID=A0A914AN18_PATMI|nr:E3 ubiquitin-protein ligase TRIM71-like [Patiria miniata]